MLLSQLPFPLYHCHLLAGGIFRAQPSDLDSGYVTDNSRIYPLERFNTVEIEKAYVDKLDKNAVFYLNYLSLSEDAVSAACMLLLYRALSEAGCSGISASFKYGKDSVTDISLARFI